MNLFKDQKYPEIVKESHIIIFSTSNFESSEP